MTTRSGDTSPPFRLLAAALAVAGLVIVVDVLTSGAPTIATWLVVAGLTLLAAATLVLAILPRTVEQGSGTHSTKRLSPWALYVVPTGLIVVEAALLAAADVSDVVFFIFVVVACVAVVVWAIVAARREMPRSGR